MASCGLASDSSFFQGLSKSCRTGYNLWCLCLSAQLQRQIGKCGCLGLGVPACPCCKVSSGDLTALVLSYSLVLSCSPGQASICRGWWDVLITGERRGIVASWATLRRFCVLAAESRGEVVAQERESIPKTRRTLSPGKKETARLNSHCEPERRGREVMLVVLQLLPCQILANRRCHVPQHLTYDIEVDGDTAHPNLSIDVDKKSFTHKSHAQKTTQTEKSFDSAVCVLGSEGFSSGKHYWEVDVEKSNDWDLGVAGKSAQRKGPISLSPKDQFWVLGLSSKNYWVRTGALTRLAVQKNPRKVGVYLNCEEKSVTFFNVTDMSVMFTFKDCAFSEELYPFFKISQKESTMRICSVKEE
uniref:B30.2/SPRY domain-containing protein n=1 Tax=Calidris pygmaea TaxID=425635 RepID=A0A8C3JZW1_9CHAR